MHNHRDKVSEGPNTIMPIAEPHTAVAVSKPPVSVAVVHPNGTVRSKLCGLLRRSNEIRLLCESSTLESTLPDLLRLKISVLVFWGDRPESACTAIRKVNALAPATATLLLSPCSEPRSILRLLASGAAGYIAASSPPEHLTRAVGEVAKDRLFLDLQAGLAVSEHISQIECGPPLTGRQREICVWLCSRGDKAVARGLALSVQTVHTHAKAIYKKLGVHGRQGLLERLSISSHLDPNHPPLVLEQL